MSPATGPRVRLLTCPGCGAPLDVPASGGTTRCGYCGSTAVFDAAPRPATPRGSMLDEPTRLAGLRAQRDLPENVPAVVAELYHQGALRPERVADAMQLYLRCASALRGGAGADQADILFHVALGLYNVYASDQRQQRALLETAAELLRDTPHQAVVCGMLSRSDVRSGNLDEARAWLAFMDPRAERLDADSAYRFSRAYLAAAEGAGPVILDLLGRRPGEAPLAVRDELLCAVLRAHGHELLGDVDTAAALLVEFMRQAPHFPRLCEQIIAANPTLGLCPRSYPQARAAFSG